MSVNRDMRPCKLQKNVPERTASGAERNVWRDEDEIEVAIYKKNDMKVVASEKYLQSSHTGLTRCKDIEADAFRLVKDGVIYQIVDCNTQSRLTNLLLKAVR